MDPNANLQEQERTIIARDAVKFVDPFGSEHLAYRAALRQLRAELNEWLAKGGFEPEWDKYPLASRYFGE